MTFWDAFIQNEWFCFIAERYLLYGTDHVDQNIEQYTKEFEHEIRNLSDVELEKRMERFKKIIEKS